MLWKKGEGREEVEIEVKKKEKRINTEPRDLEHRAKVKSWGGCSAVCKKNLLPLP